MLPDCLWVIALETLSVLAGAPARDGGLRTYRNGEFPVDRDSGMTFELPRYFTEHPSRNKKLVDLEALVDTVESVIRRCGLGSQAEGNEERRMSVLGHLHRAFCRERMTNVDVINILSIIGHNHNIFVEFNVDSEDRSEGVRCRGLTQIFSANWFVDLDRISGERAGHYEKHQYRLDRLGKHTIHDEVRLYNEVFSQVHGARRKHPIAQILRNYGSPECLHIDVKLCGVGRRKVRAMPTDDLFKLNRRWHIHRMLGEEMEGAHREMLRSQ